MEQLITIFGALGIFFSIGVFLYGLSLFIGFGWATFILDLLSMQASGDYAYLQRNGLPGPKSKGKRYALGFVLMLLSAACFTVIIS